MKFRRHLPERGRWSAWLAPLRAWRPRIRLPKPRFAFAASALFLATVIGGYLLAALVFFPAPMFASNRTVPTLFGLDDSAAVAALHAKGLTINQAEPVQDPSVPAGHVLWQDPPPGVIVPDRTPVTVTRSTGPARVPVPDVVGYEASLARLLIRSSGLSVDHVDQTQAPTPKDVTVNTRPPAGTALPPGSGVTLVVSVGAPTIRVPSVIGMTFDDAKAALEAAGLTVGTNYSRTAPAGTPVGSVLEQRPGAGTLSAPGTAIDLIVAKQGGP